MSDIRFYCEHCGKHVRSKDKICTSCGSFFTQVRCPVCDFQGEVDLFLKGCPSCGYTGKAGETAGSRLEGFEEVDFRPEHEPPARGRSSFGFRGPLAFFSIMGAVVFLAFALFYLVFLRN